MSDDNFGFEPISDETKDENFGFELHPDEKEKVAQYMQQTSPDEFDSALKGAEQGLTLGFPDEISGALGAGLETFAGSEQPLEALYREYRDAARQRYKRAEEAHPNLYKTGEVVGGLLVPVGAAGALKNASLAQKIKAGTKIGVGLGGAAAAGYSENPLVSSEFAKDVGAGAGTGAVVGGGVPLVAPVIKGVTSETVGGLKWLGNKILGPVDEAAKMGYAGTKATSEQGIKSIMSDVGQFASEVAPNLQKDINDVAILKNQLIADAQKAGIKADENKINQFIKTRLGDDIESNLPEVKRELEQYRELLRTAHDGPLVEKSNRIFYGDAKSQIGKFEDLFIQKQAEQNLAAGSQSAVPLEVLFEPTDIPNKTLGLIRQKQFDVDGHFIGYKKLASKLLDVDEAAKFKDITETVRSGGKDLRNPEELYQLYKDLKQKSSYGDYSFKSAEVQRQTGKSIDDVKNMLRETVPGVKSADEKIYQLNQAAEALGIADTRNINEKQIRDRILSIIGQEGKVGVGAIKAQETINNFIEKLAQVNPEMATKLQQDFAKFGTKVHTIQEINKPLNLLSLASPLSITRTLGTGAANLGGYYAGQTTRAAGTLAEKGVAQIEKYTPEVLKSKAAQIAQKGSGVAQELSNILVKAANADERSRNAILFGIMQNPAYRQYLNENEDNQVP